MSARRLVGKLVGSFGREIYYEMCTAWARPVFAPKDVDYDEYWRKRKFVAVQPRFPLMSDLIPEGATVLDIGCGDGGFLSYLKSQKTVRECGIDIADPAVDACRNLGLNARRVTLFELAAEDPPDKQFDIVVMSEVIEHVPNSEDFLRTAWSLTRSRLIISFPNIAFWPHRLRLLLGRNPIQWLYYQAEPLRFWSLNDFLDWVAAMQLPGYN
ncbi:MAG TPA: methionine biosynthesis protein MetW, partial [Bryobacteraceae bacterium]|nr:methionine biosynthesis protein MetW [Bryobacteraceae bacterium]